MTQLDVKKSTEWDDNDDEEDAKSRRRVRHNWGQDKQTMLAKQASRRLAAERFRVGESYLRDSSFGVNSDAVGHLDVFRVSFMNFTKAELAQYLALPVEQLLWPEIDTNGRGEPRCKDMIGSDTTFALLHHVMRSGYLRRRVIEDPAVGTVEVATLLSVCVDAMIKCAESMNALVTVCTGRAAPEPAVAFTGPDPLITWTHVMQAFDLVVALVTLELLHCTRALWPFVAMVCLQLVIDAGTADMAGREWPQNERFCLDLAGLRKAPLGCKAVICAAILRVMDWAIPGANDGMACPRTVFHTASDPVTKLLLKEIPDGGISDGSGLWQRRQRCIERALANSCLQCAPRYFRVVSPETKRSSFVHISRRRQRPPRRIGQLADPGFSGLQRLLSNDDLRMSAYHTRFNVAYDAAASARDRERNRIVAWWLSLDGERTKVDRGLYWPQPEWKLQRLEATATAAVATSAGDSLDESKPGVMQTPPPPPQSATESKKPPPAPRKAAGSSGMTTGKRKLSEFVISQGGLDTSPLRNVRFRMHPAAAAVVEAVSMPRSALPLATTAAIVSMSVSP